MKKIQHNGEAIKELLNPSKKSNISCMICKKPHELKGFDKNYI